MRKPARLERAGALTPRDRMWAVIRTFGMGNEFSVAEIVVLSGQDTGTVMPYLTGLCAGGYVAPEQHPKERPIFAPRRECRRFMLILDIGVEAPRVTRDGKPVTQGTGREQMWTVVRKFKGGFDWRDIVLACPVNPTGAEAKYYLKYLALAGYLRIAVRGRATGRSAGGSGGTGAATQYEFIRARDTGPRAPIVSRDRSVMDANTGKIMFNGGNNDDEQRGHEQGAGAQ